MLEVALELALPDETEPDELLLPVELLLDDETPDEDELEDDVSHKSPTPSLFESD